MGAGRLLSSAPMIIVVFGPSGSGKTVVGRALAERLGWRFLEGDAYHSPENIAMMRSGKPLTDAERGPWLAALAREIASTIADGRDAVLACSALKKSYRRKLLPPDTAEEVSFVYLKASPEVLEERLKRREEHFFPPQLLRTQLEALEAPGEEEGVLVTDAEQPIDAVVTQVMRTLGLRAAKPRSTVGRNSA
jgi:gluconokinase